tara:strand:+ start:6936 stop:7511 length:576 start_codon:yes stop_codon:yes gene_type:complete
VLIMKEIKKVKLGVNKDAIVVVSSDVEMTSKDDADEAYIIMFNIIGDPLRLGIIVVGNMLDKAIENTNLSKSQLVALMETNPEKYLEAAMKDPDRIFDSAQEMVKIVLDSEKKAAQARLILASMVDNGHYLQRTRYSFNGEEIEIKEQKIETEELALQLKAMIEIVKQWETFDMEEYQREMEAALKQMMKS